MAHIRVTLSQGKELVQSIDNLLEYCKHPDKCRIEPIASNADMAKHEEMLQNVQKKAKTKETKHITGGMELQRRYNKHLARKEVYNAFNSQKKASLPLAPTIVVIPSRHAGSRERREPRINSKFCKIPRLDPFRSSWDAEQRQCFFTSSFQPQHLRAQVPFKLPVTEARSSRRSLFVRDAA